MLGQRVAQGRSIRLPGQGQSIADVQTRRQVATKRQVGATRAVSAKLGLVKSERLPQPLLNSLTPTPPKPLNGECRTPNTCTCNA